jgi:hypothetical protein
VDGGGGTGACVLFVFMASTLIGRGRAVIGPGATAVSPPSDTSIDPGRCPGTTHRPTLDA